MTGYRQSENFATRAGKISGEQTMLWLGIGVAVVGAIVVFVLSAKRPADELGSVSARWIAEHRTQR